MSITLSLKHALLVVLLSIVHAPSISYAMTEPVVVRSSIHPTKDIWVGQRVNFFVELLSSQELKGTPRFDIPTLDSAIFTQLASAPLLGTIELDGQVYTSRRFEFLLYPRKSGELLIPSLQVRISVIEGDEPVQKTFETEQLRIQVNSPPSLSDSQSILTTSSLIANQSWEASGKLSEPLLVGDSIRRTITVEVIDVIGIAIPQLVVTSPDGLSLYREPPEVDDQVNRGSLTGSRKDTFTYICVKPGSYQLPTLVYRWWDPQLKRMKVVELEGRSFMVQRAKEMAGDNGMERESIAQPFPNRKRTTVAALSGLLALVVFAWIVWRVLPSRIAHWKQKTSQQEPALFRACIRACKQGSPHAVYSAVCKWRDATQLSCDNSFTEAFEDLQLAMVQPERRWNNQPMLDALVSARRSQLQTHASQRGCLGRLNP
jgi:hypothetical protein